MQRRVEAELARCSTSWYGATTHSSAAATASGHSAVTRADVDRTYGEAIGGIRITLTEHGRRDPLFRTAGTTSAPTSGTRRPSARCRSRRSAGHVTGLSGAGLSRPDPRLRDPVPSRTRPRRPRHQDRGLPFAGYFPPRRPTRCSPRPARAGSPRRQPARAVRRAVRPGLTSGVWREVSETVRQQVRMEGRSVGDGGSRPAANIGVAHSRPAHRVWVRRLR